VTERAASCPNCGAEIVFRWSGAVQTSCPACGSVLVRHDLDLERVGSVGDVPPSMSRIQLGTEGFYKSPSFVVVGRIIYEFERGHWSEWHIRLSDGSSAWLSDAQSEYAITKQVDTQSPLAPASSYHAGQPVTLQGTDYTVSVVTRALYAGVEGELPFEYWDKLRVEFVDLKAPGNHFATIDYSDTSPLLYVGEYVAFEDLRLTNLRDDSVAGAGGATAKDVRGLNCPQCGAPIELRTGQLAQTVACPACTAILDARDPNLAVLQQHQQKTKAAVPLIPLGTIGNLGGDNWQVIGFQVRGVTVSGVIYSWREYLLWNAEHGFRYLTEYDGHWNDVTVMKGVPEQISGGRQPVVAYNDTTFKHFQSAVATTLFVLGEFPWEVRTGDHVQADDYVSPPFMLSREKTDDEVTWSLGTYTSAERIAQAFRLPTALPPARGVYANQPNPKAGSARGLRTAFGLFALATIVLMAARFVTAGNEQVLTQTRSYSPATGDTGAFVTPVFTLNGHTSNVQLQIETNLSNAWAYFNLALLAENGGAGYDFGREVSYYSGVDDGESWREGSPRDKVVLPSIPSGRYYLRVDPQRDESGPPFSYTISVRRDVPRAWPFLLALALLAIPPIVTYFRQVSFEYARWRESDYPWSSSSDGGDDDE
jgi:predicted RNA-binding Zn-ribbon protein involved in translation (DUF1610 family)